MAHLSHVLSLLPIATGKHSALCIAYFMQVSSGLRSLSKAVGRLDCA
jgi:hypothetical protein